MISNCSLYYNARFKTQHWAALQAIEVTIQNLIGSGMDPKTENNPYLGFIYTSFQVRTRPLCRLFAEPSLPPEFRPSSLKVVGSGPLKWLQAAARLT